MLAQAEHDLEASAILLTTSKRLAQGRREGNRQTTRNAADGKVAREVDREKQRDIVVNSMAEAVDI